MFYSRIAGVGSYLPEKILTNDDMAEFIDTTDEWITKRVGIRQRHVVSEGESLTSLMHKAAVAALASATLEPNDIDLIIVGTTTGDCIFPSAACLLQNALGISNRCAAFDLNAACAGFIYALNVADQFIKSQSNKNILVVGADAFSRIVDWGDRSTCVLFGDGAAAVILQASEKPGIIATDIHADGSYHDLLYAKNPIWHADKPCVKMEGREVFKFATNTLGDAFLRLIEQAGLSPDDVDWLIPHQANQRILDAIARKLNLSPEKIIQTVEYHANTSAASVPLALDAAINTGKIKRGDILLLEAFGGGFAWGAALVEY